MSAEHHNIEGSCWRASPIIQYYFYDLTGTSKAPAICSPERTIPNVVLRSALKMASRMRILAMAIVLVLGGTRTRGQRDPPSHRRQQLKARTALSIGPDVACLIDHPKLHPFASHCADSFASKAEPVPHAAASLGSGGPAATALALAPLPAQCGARYQRLRPQLPDTVLGLWLL